MVITRKRAMKDPVIGQFIEYAADELQYHRRFKIAPIIKRHDQLRPYRDWIHKHIQVIRRVLEIDYEFGNLIPIQFDGGIAGKGHGSKTIGFVLACADNETLVDEALARKQDIALGIQTRHNIMSDQIAIETGHERATLEFVLSTPEEVGEK